MKSQPEAYCQSIEIIESPQGSATIHRIVATNTAIAKEAREMMEDELGQQTQFLGARQVTVDADGKKDNFLVLDLYTTSSDSTAGWKPIGPLTLKQ